jgi:SAM-dependent methyltransferase
MTPDERGIALASLAPYIERARTFTGWDFAGVGIRELDGPLPWDYEAEARALATNAARVLDVGTGGGEVVSRIAEGLDARLVAAEEWRPNARVAANRLRPLGIDVVHCRTDVHDLPFRDDSFDLVLSRHEAIRLDEIDRILAPGGQLLTQQCAPENWSALRPFVPRMTRFPDHYHEYPAALWAMGYEAHMQRFDFRTAFATLGDLVFMLLVTPWTIPEFDPDADLEALLLAEAALSTPDGIVLDEGRYLLSARKPPLS